LCEKGPGRLFINALFLKGKKFLWKKFQTTDDSPICIVCAIKQSPFPGIFCHFFVERNKYGITVGYGGMRRQDSAKGGDRKSRSGESG
jgi:hypothetical protein